MRRAAAGLLVVLVLAGCGRLADRGEQPDTPATVETTPTGESPAAASPVPTPAGEDGATATAVPGLAELEAAVGDAGTLADEIESDLAADGS